MELPVTNPLYDWPRGDGMARKRVLVGVRRIWNQTEDDPERNQHRFP